MGAAHGVQVSRGAFWHGGKYFTYAMESFRIDNLKFRAGVTKDGRTAYSDWVDCPDAAKETATAEWLREHTQTTDAFSRHFE